MMFSVQLINFLTTTLCLFQILLIMSCIDGKQHHSAARYRKATPQHVSTIDVKDKILELQCYAKCEKDVPVQSELSRCHEQCKNDVIKVARRGACPNQENAIFQNIAILQKLSCLDNCNYDFDCPEVQKCCQSTCGPVCMNAIGVRDDNMLPPIPKILKFKLPRGHKVEITIESSANSSYYFHVEVRSHIGLAFSPRKLGMWQWQPVEKIAEISDMRSKRTDVSFNLKPAHWYQVRIAAINAYGFRGYSVPSEPFKLLNSPKPPKPPIDLKVASSRLNGRYCSVQIIWCPSKSNLPIEKYRIIWSLYIKSKDESLISNAAYVRDVHQFEITQLLADSSYYIQVQAISICGHRRLKSEKISLLYNTTTTTTLQSQAHTHPPLKCHTNHAYDTSTNAASVQTSTQLAAANASNTSSMSYAHMEVRFRLNRRFGMIVQIYGFHPHREKVYELCPKDTNCEQREYSAIRAKKDALEFSKLKYNTTYMLKAYKTSQDKSDQSAGSFIFTTPKCESFRKGFPKMQIKC